MKYNNITPFKWCIMQNFPFIEATFDAIDNYQLWCKVVEYLNKVINQTNLTGQQMEKVTNDFINLQNYVNNYFKNLNVQDEINNKLDELVADGTLEEILNNSILPELNTRLTANEEKTNQNTINIDISKNQLKNILPIRKNFAKTVGHRGVSQEEPENTIPSFRQAGTQEFWGCETDIQVTADDQIVCFHDDTLTRMTGESGTIAQKTLAQLLEYNIIAGANIDSYENLKIPTFEQYLQVCYQYNMVPVVEIKAVRDFSNLDKVVDILRNYGFEDNAIIISFNMDFLNYIRSISNIKIQALLTLTEENILYCKERNFDIDCPAGEVTLDLVKFAHLNGVKVNCWNITSIWVCQGAISNQVDFVTIDSIKYYLPVFGGTGARGIVNGMNYFNDYELKLINMSSVGTTNIIKTIICHGFGSAPIPKYPGGYQSPSTNRAMCTDLIKATNQNTINYNILDGYRMTFHSYSADGSFINDSKWKTGLGTFTPPSNTAYIVPYFSLVNNGLVKDSDFEKMKTFITSIT